MINYFKYLPVSKEDEDWGLCVLNAGCTHIGPSSSYPSDSHPSHHNFNWKNGRKLEEYQIIYITNGEGIFESASCKQQVIKDGMIILLFPGEMHRYKPNELTGWDEYWIGIKGDIVDNLIKNLFFKRENPTLNIGFNETITNIFNCIIEKTKHEGTGYQPLISGAALHLMGEIYASFKKTRYTQDDRQIMVNKARHLFRSNITNDFSPEQLAKELQVGYSWFRKVFKTYTGLAPGQFFIQLKIERAKELLVDPQLSIKQIAYELKFDSCFYFSKIFKEKTGINPSDYRHRTFKNFN